MSTVLTERTEQILKAGTNSPLEALEALMTLQTECEEIIADLVNRGSALEVGLAGLRSDPEVWQDSFVAQVEMFTRDVDRISRYAIRLRLFNREGGVAWTGDQVSDEAIERAGGELFSEESLMILHSEQVRNALRSLGGPEPDLISITEARAVFGADAGERVAEYRKRTRAR